MIGALLRQIAFALGALGVAGGVLSFVVGDQVRHVVLEEPWWLLALTLPFVAVIVRTWSSPRPAVLRFSRLRSLRRIPRA